MLELIVGTVCCTILAALMLNVANGIHNSVTMFLFSLLLAIVAGTGATYLTLCGFHYVAAKHKVEIINTKYGTNYTQDQVFYAEDIIEEIHQIQRSRVEINGNLFNNLSK